MNWDKTMYSKQVKEALGENYTEEDVMIVIDASCFGMFGFVLLYGKSRRTGKEDTEKEIQ